MSYRQIKSFQVADADEMNENFYALAQGHFLPRMAPAMGPVASTYTLSGPTGATFFCENILADTYVGPQGIEIVDYTLAVTATVLTFTGLTRNTIYEVYLFAVWHGTTVSTAYIRTYLAPTGAAVYFGYGYYAVSAASTNLAYNSLTNYPLLTTPNPKDTVLVGLTHITIDNTINGKPCIRSDRLARANTAVDYFEVLGGYANITMTSLQFACDGAGLVFDPGTKVIILEHT